MFRVMVRVFRVMFRVRVRVSVFRVYGLGFRV